MRQLSAAADDQDHAGGERTPDAGDLHVVQAALQRTIRPAARCWRVQR